MVGAGGSRHDRGAEDEGRPAVGTLHHHLSPSATRSIAVSDSGLSVVPNGSFITNVGDGRKC